MSAKFRHLKLKDTCVFMAQKNSRSMELMRLLMQKSSQRSLNEKREGMGFFAQKRWKYFFRILVLFALLFFVGHTLRSLHKFHKMTREHEKTLNLLTNFPYQAIPALGNTIRPFELSHVPYGEDIGVVLGVKTLSVQGVTAPYNPSIVKKGNDYLLFFRQDFPTTSAQPAFFTHIGLAVFNEKWEEKAPYRWIDVGNEFAEDPRVTYVGEDLYLSYNTLQSSNSRSIHVSKLDNNFKPGFITNLDMHSQIVEKNWSPFEYKDPQLGPQLYFEYGLQPPKLLWLPNPQVNELRHLVFAENKPVRFPWKSWGHPSGGACAQLIGDEYLNFFHSRFIDRLGTTWYVMGAYTFSAKPPFHLTAVSNYPILFHGIYETPHINTAPAGIRCIFPAGFIIEEQDGKEVIQLACGENDCAIKIVTIDKQALLKSLKKLKYVG